MDEAGSHVVGVLPLPLRRTFAASDVTVCPEGGVGCESPQEDNKAEHSKPGNRTARGTHNNGVVGGREGQCGSG